MDMQNNEVRQLRWDEYDTLHHLRAAAKQALNTSPKGGDTVGMQYDVILPGGKPVGGLTPWTAEYNKAGSAGGGSCRR